MTILFHSTRLPEVEASRSIVCALDHNGMGEAEGSAVAGTRTGEILANAREQRGLLRAFRVYASVARKQRQLAG